MATRTADIASAVVSPAISIIRRTRAKSAACSWVGSGAKVSVIRLIFGTRLVFSSRSKDRGHGCRRRGGGPARPRAGAPAFGGVAVAGGKGGSLQPKLGWESAG